MTPQFMNKMLPLGFCSVCVLWCTALVCQQVGLLLLSKVLESNPEPFKPHYSQLLELFRSVLQDHNNNPTALYYCILALTAVTPYTGTEELVRHCHKKHAPYQNHNYIPHLH